ncbi:MAG: hypothetical protein D6721_04240 [Gammaproteobacteria bacterium]|nr:MAG: hypothetical protein D6721_04240 [Gammaproteobacteria bacterium]
MHRGLGTRSPAGALRPGGAGAWRRCVACLLLCLVGFGTAHAAGVTAVPRVQDLQALGREARARGLPILLAFMASDCAYCETVEEDFLVPMLISGDYDDRVLIRKVVIDGNAWLRDFDGRRIDPEDLARRYGVRMTPTLLFLDPGGREIAERMVGLTTPDFYGGYIDAGIAQARRHLHGSQPSS